MLRKFSRSLERKRDGKTGVKYRFDLQVVKVTGAFASNASLRVLWTRGSKVQVTQAALVTAGTAQFNRHLSQVATLYKDAKDQFEAKEYVFKLQSVGSDTASKKTTVGKGTLDLSQFAATGSYERVVIVPLSTTQPQTAKALELHVRVTSALLKGMGTDDGFSTVSGLSTLTSVRSNSVEQDLTGFDNDVYRVNSETIGALTVAESADLNKSLSHDSENSTVSTMATDVHEGAADVVAGLQSRMDALEDQLKKQAVEKEDLLRAFESQRRQAEAEAECLKRELESERAQKAELEIQLVKEVDETGGEMDLEEALRLALAPYEMRYAKLADAYQELLQQSRSEIEALQDELLASNDRTGKLQNQLEASERARESLNVEKRALEMSLIGSCTEHVDMDKERKELREELTHVDEVMQELIQTKLSYAELSERHTITRREMCKMKEKNLQLASKITRMETYLYLKQSTRGSRS